jgi:hypothetical protein
VHQLHQPRQVNVGVGLIGFDAPDMTAQLTLDKM